MAYPDYRTDFPVVVTNVDGERQGQYCAGAPGYQDLRLLAAEPWVPMIPGGSGGLPTQHVGVREGHAPLNYVYPPRHSPGPTSRRNLHVATNISRSGNTDMWPQMDSGITLVQSPSTYSPLSPTFHGAPSIPRHKIVHITLDGVNYARVDLTRHSDAGAIRRDIISRLLPRVTSNSFSDFDIFRTHPPGPAGALNDAELILNLEHFGDDRCTLGFLVQAVDEYSDSHLPTYARAATTHSLNPSHSVGFPSPSLNPPPRNSMAGSAGWYSRRNLHVATNISRSGNTDMWPQMDSGIALVQSPSTYSPLSPTFHGTPSIPRHKIVHITLDGVNYAQVDLAGHSDAGAIRRDIISRLLPRVTSNSFSDFDIFRTHPPGPAGALNDAELILNLEHFGDDRCTLKFLVQAVDEYSDSHLPTYARAATTHSLNPSHSVGFPSPSLNPSRNSMAGSAGWYGLDASTSGTRGYTRTPQSLESHSTYSPSMRVSMPIPMPAPTPIRQPTGSEAPGFPTTTHSTDYTSPAIFAPAIENSSTRTFGRQSAFINPPELPPRSNAMVAGHSRNTSDCHGRENMWGSVGGHNGQCQPSSSRARPNSVVISGTMATEEVLSHLYERGCRNVA
ncbi:hypothetical protein RSAG8_07963, partial [Rhizoctonia solani AG-8 WAC10335]